MTPARWRKVNEIFHAVCEQPASQQDEFLRQACGDDQELYSEVHRMLLEESRSGFLDHPPLAAAQSPALAFSPGQTVSGRYRIVRFVGRGGMGEVYEAEDLELKERVAVKTLLAAVALDGRRIARFKQEIQLSRRVAHPNVCRVFDLARHPADGSSDAAVVFLSMEFLPGETLDAMLRREGRLSTGAALPLLKQMADALDAAHRARVIHRDFKPSNVMLSLGEVDRRVVVTDFGLARSFATSGETTATLSGQVMGTFDYMAPELLAGGEASVASDIYALGMVAYKMVTGALPYPSNTPFAGAILRSKMPAPSPGTEVPGLDPKFDQAIQRALEPDPSLRFASAGEFFDALQSGATSTRITRASLTRRNLAIAGIAAMILMAGAIAWSAWTNSRNQPSAEAATFYHKGIDDIHAGAYFAATKALDQAVRIAPHFSLAHARLAEAWVELDIPEKAGREMLLARRENTSGLSELDRLQIEAVDLTITREFSAAVSKYEHMRVLAGEQADLDVDLGRAYEKALQPVKATGSYRRAAEGPSHNPAAWLRLAVLYSRASDSAKATEAFHQAEEQYQITSNFEGLTEVAQQRGIAANARGQLPEAATNLLKALETARLAGNLQQEISAKLRLSTNAYLSGDTALTERYAREALTAAQANQMEGMAIRGIITLGNAYLRKGDLTGAEKYYQDALALARRSDSHRLAALSQLSLAALYDQLKRSDDAGREAQAALAFYEPNRFARETLQGLTILGRSQSRRGEYAAATESFQRSLNMAESVQDAFQIALAHESMGSVFFDQERYPEALSHFQKNLELGTDTEHLGYAALQCGNTLWLLGRFDEARSMFAKADSSAAKFRSLQLAIARSRAEMALSEGNNTEAASLCRRILSGSPGPVEGAQATRVLGTAQISTGAQREGLRNCEAAVSMAEKLQDRSLLVPAQLALAEARLDTGDTSGALSTLHQAEPALANLPVSRWRALAISTRSSPSKAREYGPAAKQQLDEIARQWGADAFQVYLKRPDVQKQLRPLSYSFSASH